MKTLHLSITVFSFVLMPILFGVAFGSEPCPASGYVHYGPSRQSIPCYLASPQYNSVVEEQSQKINMTINTPAFCDQYFDQGPTLAETIGEQQCENPTYQINYNGSKLLVTNIINKTTFKEQETITVIPELTNIGNHTVSLSHCGPLFVTLIIDQHGKIVSPQYAWACPLVDHGMILAPNVSTPGESYGQIITLDTPGNYTMTSIATFGGIPNTIVLWSKPLQITVLPEKMAYNQTMVQSGSIPTNQITKIISLDDFRKTIASKYAHTDDWQHIVRLRSLSWAQDNKTIIIKTDNSFAGPNLWSLRMDGTELQSISLNDTVMKNLRYPPNQLGNMTVSVPQCDKCPSFGIILGTVDNNYQQALYNGDSTPEYPAISSDGKYVVFAYDVNSSWDKPEENGIYVITLGTPIPEFPFTIPVFLVSTASLIVFYRMKIRK